MAWLESHQSLRDHPKARRLARRLDGLPASIGHLHALWWWCLDYAPNGDLTRYQVDADRLADLAAAAHELVQIEGALRLAETQAGKASSGPPARELAVELLHGRLARLRPYLPFCTTESADRAQKALTQ
jgi:hypothetical protein